MKRLGSNRPISSLIVLALLGVGCNSSNGGADVDDGQGGQGSESVTGGGGAGGVEATATTGGALAELIIDDFEDGDGKPLVGAGWYAYTDQTSGGLSTVTFPGTTGTTVAMGGDGYESTRSLQFDYALDIGTLSYNPFIGVGVSMGTSSAPYDLGDYSAVSYTYKGGAHRLQLVTFDVTDYDFYGVDLAAVTDWTTVNLPLTYFAQQGWGTSATLNPANVQAFVFAVQGTTGTTGTLQVDNLKLVQQAASTTPDMAVNDAAPPDYETVDSIEITNPLQAKAETYLNRGYNITNWLEQSRFTEFTYDQAWVQKLASAGFKSLRLPIDLDLYVESTTGTGSELDLTVSSDLFTILDSFDDWTVEAGISLTIDYHQYDTSIAMTDADSLAKAVKLWGKVAEHFAGNTREDLFFELLNEPDLSMSTAPTQAEWTGLAEQMIAEIRAYDTTHTLIFGDVEWYSIDTLATRTPLSDSNVIYAVHDYEPFIFTHQGASWTTMGSTHDIPYPYDPERWSQYYADLGFSPLMANWILSLAQSYYVDGSRAALYNHLLDAKRWAVANNVPVICNEFGAYDATSQLEDRTRYYTDVVSVFDELKIPWQIWFMIMDDTGTVTAEDRTALGLDE